MPYGGIRPPCTIEGCDRPNHARGLCPLHYQRLRQTGDVEVRGQTYYRCQVCHHPLREWIEVAYVGGVLTLQEIAEVAGFGGARPDKPIFRHAQHAGLPRTRILKGARCPVCWHPQVDDIDAALTERGKYPANERGHRLGCPPPLMLPAIAERFGLTFDNVRTHSLPEHQERRARYEIARLEALR